MVPRFPGWERIQTMLPNMGKHFCNDLLPVIREHFRGCEKCRKGLDEMYSGYPMVGMLLGSMGMSKRELVEFLTKEKDNGTN